jgi:bacteriocin-like protein
MAKKSKGKTGGSKKSAKAPAKAKGKKAQELSDTDMQKVSGGLAPVRRLR